jgi:hypothetical protein
MVKYRYTKAAIAKEAHWKNRAHMQAFVGIRRLTLNFLFSDSFNTHTEQDNTL